MFHEVGPDEQNARGPREAVNDLGTKCFDLGRQVTGWAFERGGGDDRGGT